MLGVKNNWGSLKCCGQKFGVNEVNKFRVKKVGVKYCFVFGGAVKWNAVNALWEI